jgi:hypothetical protein
VTEQPDQLDRPLESTDDDGRAHDVTGNPRVDAALARLAELDGAPTELHAEVYEGVQHQLHGAMADLDDE